MADRSSDIKEEQESDAWVNEENGKKKRRLTARKMIPVKVIGFKGLMQKNLCLIQQDALILHKFKVSAREIYGMPLPSPRTSLMF